MQLLERVAEMGIFKGLHLDYDHREVTNGGIGSLGRVDIASQLSDGHLTINLLQQASGRKSFGGLGVNQLRQRLPVPWMRAVSARADGLLGVVLFAGPA